MRRSIKTEEINPGKKAFLWEGYCLKIDNLRRELIPGYDPMALAKEEDARDWNNFEKYYENKCMSDR